MLRLVAIGLSNDDIARRLVVSPRTVHAHVRALFANWVSRREQRQHTKPASSICSRSDDRPIWADLPIPSRVLCIAAWFEVHERR